MSPEDLSLLIIHPLDLAVVALRATSSHLSKETCLKQYQADIQQILTMADLTKTIIEDRSRITAVSIKVQSHLWPHRLQDRAVSTLLHSTVVGTLLPQDPLPIHDLPKHPQSSSRLQLRHAVAHSSLQTHSHARSLSIRYSHLPLWRNLPHLSIRNSHNYHLAYTHRVLLILLRKRSRRQMLLLHHQDHEAIHRPDRLYKPQPRRLHRRKPERRHPARPPAIEGSLQVSTKHCRVLATVVRLSEVAQAEETSMRQ